MEQLTLEGLPQAFILLTKEVSEIKQLVLKRSIEEQRKINNWFDVENLCIYHPDKPKKQTVYKWVNKGSIPYHKTGKRLRFYKDEIDNWLCEGGIKTNKDAIRDVDAYLSKKVKYGKK
jgi:excisionase family DNA binding protein